MKRALALALVLVAASPGVAYASPLDFSATVSMATGVTSLLLGGMLLLVVVKLRRVAQGSAIVESIGYVVAASLCLVASVLVGWVGRFTDVVSADLVSAGADILVMFSMLFFAIYFARVRSALASFLVRLHSDDVLAAANGADVEEDGVA